MKTQNKQEESIRRNMLRLFLLFLLLILLILFLYVSLGLLKDFSNQDTCQKLKKAGFTVKYSENTWPKDCFVKIKGRGYLNSNYINLENEIDLE